MNREIKFTVFLRVAETYKPTCGPSFLNLRYFSCKTIFRLFQHFVCKSVESLYKCPSFTLLFSFLKCEYTFVLSNKKKFTYC